VTSMISLTNTDFPNLSLLSKGKVRDIYSVRRDDHLLFVATDRISAYDVILRNVGPLLHSSP
jgi:phosphoribosylaminoimidazole-succinocarboxamide synthase